MSSLQMRSVEVFDEQFGEFVTTAMSQLKSGNYFRMFEPDGTPVDHFTTIFQAVSMPSFGPNEYGDEVWGIYANPR